MNTLSCAKPLDFRVIMFKKRARACQCIQTVLLTFSLSFFETSLGPYKISDQAQYDIIDIVRY